MKAQKQAPIPEDDDREPELRVSSYRGQEDDGPRKSEYWHRREGVYRNYKSPAWAAENGRRL